MIFVKEPVMQKVFDDCSELDRRCYDKFALSEDILMEHAANAMAQYIRNLDRAGSSVCIVAGPGNNGGDGIALARLLHGDFEVSLALPYGAESVMAKQQLKRVLALGLDPVRTVPQKADIVVDALFGAGLTRPLGESGIDIVDTLNRMDSYKIACDIPTGIDPDGNPSPIAFYADVTITMGALKKSLLSDLAKPYVGKIEVADLGVSHIFYEGHTETFMLEKNDFNPPSRTNVASHKGHYGHLAVAAGKKRGAAVLCGWAALRFGVGLVTLVGKKGISQMPNSLMLSGELPEAATAVALGMGMGRTYDPIFMENDLIERDLAVLMDADICYVPWVKTLLEKCTKTVITPHPKEFAALLSTLGIDDVEVSQIQKDRFGWARRFSERYPNTVLLLKGANPLIVYKGTLYINPLGTPVLAQAGSGDVLSGLIASLLAQGHTPLNAAIQGSIAHALLARNYKGADFSAMAEDLIEGIRWLTR